MGDILDQVLITPQARDAWEQVCAAAAQAARAAGALGGYPPPADETAEVAMDGCLVIRGQLGPLAVELRVPPDHWAWAPGAVQ